MLRGTRRDEGATLRLVALHGSTRLVIHPVYECPLAAVDGDRLLLVGELVERNQHAAARALAEERTEERAGRRIAGGGDHESALPRLGEQRVVRVEIGARRMRAHERCAVIPADELRPAPPHLELHAEPLFLGDEDAIGLGDRVAGAHCSVDHDVARAGFRALVELPEQEAEQLLLRVGAQMAHDVAQRTLRDEERQVVEGPGRREEPRRYPANGAR